jgi:3-oxoacyl-[acyl-carrier protein] reductase
MDLGIAGRAALVLGASKGLGRAVATELAAEGARVAIAARSAESLAQLAEQIGATPFVHDNGDLDAIPGFVSEVTTAVGPIDILVTNTGGPPPRRDPLSHPREEWEQAHRTLVLAPLELIGAVVPGMCERGFGRIVNIASWAVREPSPKLTLSNSERSAALAAFKTLARALAGSGVTVNTVLPGRIATDRQYELVGSRERAEEIARTDVPAGRLGTPEELAAAVAFLCSQRASYITGVGLLVDGGLSRLV